MILSIGVSKLSCLKNAYSLELEVEMFWLRVSAKRIGKDMIDI